MPPQPYTWDGLNPDGTPLRWDQPGLTWDGSFPEPQTKPMKAPQLRVQLGFSNAADHSVAEITEAVIGGLYVSPHWTPPPAFPVTLIALQDALDAFTDAIAQADLGGPTDTAHKNNQRDLLVALILVDLGVEQRAPQFEVDRHRRLARGLRPGAGVGRGDHGTAGDRVLRPRWSAAVRLSGGGALIA